MDFSISPDCDARWCYGVVLFFGLYSARNQIYSRFVDMKIPGLWSVPSTWLMFGILVLIPPILFWLMDWTAALNDNSLFAALLVGIAYPTILSGGTAGLKTPTGLDPVLKPLQTFIDSIINSIIKSVNNTMTRNENRFEDFVVGRMKDSKEVLQELQQLAKDRCADGATMDQNLEKLAATIKDPALLLEKKARLIYRNIFSLSDFARILTENKLVMDGKWWKSPIYKTNLVVALMTILIAGVIAGGIYEFSRPGFSIIYYTWRLGKDKNTEIDRFRARENLRGYLSDEKLGSNTCFVITRAIKSPGLHVERVDMFLQLLLQARDQTSLQPWLYSQLINDLRVDSVDVRSRVNQALVYLALKRDPRFKETEKDLATWNPATGNSVPDLEVWVDRWRSFFFENASPAQAG